MSETKKSNPKSKTPGNLSSQHQSLQRKYLTLFEQQDTRGLIEDSIEQAISRKPLSPRQLYKDYKAPIKAEEADIVSSSSQKVADCTYLGMQRIISNRVSSLSDENCNPSEVPTSPSQRSVAPDEFVNLAYHDGDEGQEEQGTSNLVGSKKSYRAPKTVKTVPKLKKLDPEVAKALLAERQRINEEHQRLKRENNDLLELSRKLQENQNKNRTKMTEDNEENLADKYQELLTVQAELESRKIDLELEIEELRLSHKNEMDTLMESHAAMLSEAFTEKDIARSDMEKMKNFQKMKSEGEAYFDSRDSESNDSITEVVPRKPYEAFVSSTFKRQDSDFKIPDRDVMDTPVRVPKLLWVGGYLWKFPYSSSSVPHRRWFQLKSSNDLENGKKARSSGLANAIYPLTLIWFDPDKFLGSSFKELNLLEITEIRFGHETEAFKSQKRLRGGSKVPDAELCFSLVGPDRSLDLAAETLEDAKAWKEVFYSIIKNIQIREAELVADEAKKKLQMVKVVGGNIELLAPPVVKKLTLEDLFQLVELGSAIDVARCFDQGIPVDALEYDDGDTPLIWACRYGHKDIVELCLRRGARNDPHPNFGSTALQAAVLYSFVDCAEAILRYASKSGDEALICNHEDDNGDTPLHVACRIGQTAMVELLVNSGASLDLTDANGNTCLHCASQTGNEECMAYLFGAGTDYLIDQKNSNGYTALHIAAKNGHLGIARLLLEMAADPKVTTKNQKTAYQLALTKGHGAVARLIYSYACDSVVGGKLPTSPGHSKTFSHEFYDDLDVSSISDVDQSPIGNKAATFVESRPSSSTGGNQSLLFKRGPVPQLDFSNLNTIPPKQVPNEAANVNAALPKKSLGQAQGGLFDGLDTFRLSNSDNGVKINSIPGPISSAIPQQPFVPQRSGRDILRMGTARNLALESQYAAGLECSHNNNFKAANDDGLSTSHTGPKTPRQMVRMATLGAKKMIETRAPGSNHEKMIGFQSQQSAFTAFEVLKAGPIDRNFALSNIRSSSNVSRSSSNNSPYQDRVLSPQLQLNKLSYNPSSLIYDSSMNFIKSESPFPTFHIRGESINHQSNVSTGDGNMAMKTSVRAQTVHVRSATSFHENQTNNVAQEIWQQGSNSADQTLPFMAYNSNHTPNSDYYTTAENKVKNIQGSTTGYDGNYIEGYDDMGYYGQFNMNDTHWVVRSAEGGYYYYENTATGITQWEDPRYETLRVLSPPVQLESPVSPGGSREKIVTPNEQQAPSGAGSLHSSLHLSSQGPAKIKWKSIEENAHQNETAVGIDTVASNNELTSVPKENAAPLPSNSSQFQVLLQAEKRANSYMGQEVNQVANIDTNTVPGNLDIKEVKVQSYFMDLWKPEQKIEVMGDLKESALVKTENNLRNKETAESKAPAESKVKLDVKSDEKKVLADSKSLQPLMGEDKMADSAVTLDVNIDTEADSKQSNSNLKNALEQKLQLNKRGGEDNNSLKNALEQKLQLNKRGGEDNKESKYQPQQQSQSNDAKSQPRQAKPQSFLLVSKEELQKDSQFDKYFKMLTVGVPLASVVQKMAKDEMNEIDKNRFMAANGEKVAVHSEEKLEEQDEEEIVLKVDKEVLKEDPKFVKYFKMASVGIPLAVIPQKMLQEGLGSEDVDKFRAAMGEKVVLNKKKPTTPKLSKAARASQMVTLHWEQLDESRLSANSVWASPKNVNENITVNTEELGALFAKSPVKEATFFNKDTDNSKPKKVSIIDGKRAYNVEIGLTQFKSITFQSLCLSLVTMDEDTLNLDKLGNLEGLLPTPAEIREVKAYKGPMDNLGKAEEFYLTFIKYPRLKEKLKTFQIKLTCKEGMTQLRSSCIDLKQASESIRSSEAFAGVLKRLLAIGNIMNQGTSKGHAAGFTLESLLKITQVKGVDKKTTVLDYAVRSIYEKQEKQLLVFDEDFVGLEKVTNISTKEIEIKLANIKASLAEVESILQKERASLQGMEEGDCDGDTPFSALEIFCRKAGAFYNDALENYDCLESDFDKTQEEIHSLIEYFAEDPKTCKIESVFTNLINFISVFKESKEKYKRYKKQKEKAKADKDKAESPSPTRMSQTVDVPTPISGNISRTLADSAVFARVAQSRRKHIDPKDEDKDNGDDDDWK